jgi:hypothetical protein
VKMRRCEDEKMRYRPPLLEEPCAQTLSGKIFVEQTRANPYHIVGSAHEFYPHDIPLNSLNQVFHDFTCFNPQHLMKNHHDAIYHQVCWSFSTVFLRYSSHLLVISHLPLAQVPTSPSPMTSSRHGCAGLAILHTAKQQQQQQQPQQPRMTRRSGRGWILRAMWGSQVGNKLVKIKMMR